MSDPINDGGPAFPLNVKGPVYSKMELGMSLRAWLAGQALACIGPISAETIRYNSQIPNRSLSVEFSRIAAQAVAISDAVIAELSKPTTATPK